MDSSWDEYRRRRRAFWLAFPRALLWVVPGTLIRLVLVRCGLDNNTAFILAVALPMASIIMVAHVRRMFWACPRCGRPFHVTWWYGNVFSGECVHCGLPKGAPVPAQTGSL
jgi:Zn ribbon nucleic-acid-binding protein